jgi:hypothetical protein
MKTILKTICKISVKYSSKIDLFIFKSKKNKSVLVITFYVIFAIKVVF